MKFPSHWFIEFFFKVNKKIVQANHFKTVIFSGAGGEGLWATGQNSPRPLISEAESGPIAARTPSGCFAPRRCRSSSAAGHASRCSGRTLRRTIGWCTGRRRCSSAGRCRRPRPGFGAQERAADRCSEIRQLAWKRRSNTAVEMKQPQIGALSKIRGPREQAEGHNRHMPPAQPPFYFANFLL